ncbi:acetyltransferase [Babesia ovata]|uniref:Acetyltransferase n=1 Tax=Babesia ovata TaxID=189622 RepID=A0A2H6KIC6_9APIC|nr:acetyltransferase [Babesia ovata]GBE62747.1 acetyltransferase [Babesia ovata]
MKRKVQATAPKGSGDTPAQLSDMYCTQEISKILHSVTLEELTKLGLKEDVFVSYTRIVLYLLLCGIGAYSAAFITVDKNKQHLKIAVGDVTRHGVSPTRYGETESLVGNMHVQDNLKVYIWSGVNWYEGMYDIKYAFPNSPNDIATYQVPLSETFFEDGKLDEEWYHNSMVRLSDEIKAASKKAA